MSLKKPPELIKISKIVPSSEGHYMVEFAFSPCAFKVLSPCTWLLSSKKFMLCVSPAVDWCPIQGVPCLPPYDDWQRHQPPNDLKKNKLILKKITFLESRVLLGQSQYFMFTVSHSVTYTRQFVSLMYVTEAEKEIQSWKETQL